MTAARLRGGFNVLRFAIIKDGDGRNKPGHDGVGNFAARVPR
jgi:hypothetical protein